MKKKPFIPPDDKSLIFIGRYRLGWRTVEVFGDPHKSGGQFEYFPDVSLPDGKHDDETVSRMTIGFLHNDDWWEVFNVILHETWEMAAADHNVRYKRTDLFMSWASDAFVFHFNHNEFTEITAQSAHFLSFALDDIKKAWLAFRRKKRRA